MSEPTATPVTRKPLPGLGSIFLRGRTWHCEFWRHDQQYRESTRTTNEKKAVAFLRSRVDALATDRYVGPKAERVTVADVLKLVTADYATRANRSSRTLEFRVAALTDELGVLRAVAVSSQTVEAYKAKRLADGKAKATINRELACLRRGFKLAVSDKILGPSSVPAIKMYVESNVRQGILAYEDYLALLSHLPSPVDDAVTFAYLSGWRRGEILGLTWREVDRTRGLITLPAERSKNREPRELPLSPALAQLIEKRWQARLVDSPNGPKVCDLLFHRSGQPVLDFRGAWRKACKAIGKPDLLVHDLRRSAVTNLIRAGVGEQVAMRISGHRTPSVFRRYRIIQTDDVLAALTHTENTLAADPHKQAIFPHNSTGQLQKMVREPIRKIVILRKDMRQTEG